MNKLFLFILLLCFANGLYAQNKLPLYYVVKQNGKFGIVKSTDRAHFILPAVYHQLSEPNSSGEVAAKSESLWGILNIAQDTLLPLVYEDIKPLSEGLWAVKQTGAWGIWRAKNKQQILPNRYNHIKSVEDSAGKVVAWRVQQGGKHGLVDTLGNVLAETLYDDFTWIRPQVFKVWEAGKFGILAGKQLTAPVFDNIVLWEKDYLMVCQNLNYGLYTIQTKKVVMPPRYSHIKKISLPNSDIPFFACYQNMDVGLADTTHNVFLEPSSYDDFQYDAIGKIFYLRKQKHFGLVNPETKVLVNPQYTYISTFRSKVALVEKDGLFGLLNTHGEEIVPPNCTKITLKVNNAKLYKAGRQELVILDNEGRIIQYTTPQNIKTIRVTKDKQPEKSEDSVWEDDKPRTLPALPRQRYVWFRDNSRFWGLRDSIKQIIPPKYDSISTNFPAQVTLVYQGHKNNREVGLVYDSLGLVLLRPEDKWQVEEVVRDFQTQNVARLRKKNEIHYRGYIIKNTNFDSHIITEADGDPIQRVEPFQDGYSKFYIGKYTAIRGKDSLLYAKCGIMNDSGKIIIPPRYEDIILLKPTSRDIYFVLKVKKNPRYGYANTQGLLITDLKYTNARPFKEGLGAVSAKKKFFLNKRKDKHKEKTVWGFINAKGQEQIPLAYKKVYDFAEEHALVLQHGRIKYAYINTKGDTIHAFNLEGGASFKNHVAIAKKRPNRYGLMAYNGQWLVKPKYYTFSTFNLYGWAKARRYKGGTFELFDLKGHKINPYRYRRHSGFGKNGLARFQLRDYRFAWLDTLGNVQKNRIYEEVKPFQEGVSVVAHQKRWGAINENGNWIIAPKYDALSSFEQGYARALMKDKHFYIDLKENHLDSLPASLKWQNPDNKLRFPPSKSFFKIPTIKPTDGYKIVEENDKRGLQTKTGSWVVQPVYDFVTLPTEEHCVVGVYYYYGLANARGNVLLPTDYERVKWTQEGTFRIEQGKSLGYFDAKSGIWEQPLKE